MLKDVYLDTVFKCHEELPNQFLIISAYNPFGRLAPPARNLHQDSTLKSMLNHQGYQSWRIIGQSRDAQYQEPSWAFNVSLAEGKRIAKIFRQDAFYQVQDDLLILHDCDSNANQILGDFTSRLIK
jgi:hypothetical protein